jgi:hypothetical protein
MEAYLKITLFVLWGFLTAACACLTLYSIDPRYRVAFLIVTCVSAVALVTYGRVLLS